MGELRTWPLTCSQKTTIYPINSLTEYHCFRHFYTLMYHHATLGKTRDTKKGWINCCWASKHQVWRLPWQGIYSPPQATGELLSSDCITWGKRWKVFRRHKSFNGHVCSTLRKACFNHGLQDDGAHWYASLAEAAAMRPQEVSDNSLLCYLHTCVLCYSVSLREKNKEGLYEDFKNHGQLILRGFDAEFCAEFINSAYWHRR